MKIDINNKERFKILMIGRSNWIYCLDTEYPSNSIYAVTKPDEEYRGWGSTSEAVTTRNKE